MTILKTFQERSVHEMVRKKSVFRDMRDGVVFARTGKGTREWLTLLDKWGARRKGHTQTAKYLREKHQLNDWWAQCIAIRYEWKKGLRK